MRLLVFLLLISCYPVSNTLNCEAKWIGQDEPLVYSAVSEQDAENICTEIAEQHPGCIVICECTIE